MPELFKLPFDSLDSPKATPFKKLWRLSNKIITTNYDRALNITKDNDCRTILWNRKEDYSVFQNNENKFLFKLHGHIKYPESCIVFPDQYEEVYKNVITTNPTLPVHFLKTILTTHTVLFIGYGIKGDKQIDTIFQHLNGILKDVSDKKHYIFLKEGNKLKRNFLAPIYVEKYSEIDNWIDYLLKFKSTETPISDNFEPYPNEYFGRDNEVKELKKFLNNDDKHFKFIWGRGGMGKVTYYIICLSKRILILSIIN